jgi:chaperonin GroEL (HSP60 family)
MASKMVSGDAHCLSKIIVDSVLAITDTISAEKIKADVDNIKVEKKPGGSINETQIIHGIVLDKEVVHGVMPKRAENEKIALISSSLEFEKTEFDAKLNINSPEQMQRFLEEEKTRYSNQW